jgi:hypothetical protein
VSAFSAWTEAVSESVLSSGATRYWLPTVWSASPANEQGHVVVAFPRGRWPRRGGGCSVGRGKGLHPFPSTPFSASGRFLRFAPDGST